MPARQPIGMRTLDQSVMGGSPLLNPFRNWTSGSQGGLGALEDLDPYIRMMILRRLFPRGRGRRPGTTPKVEPSWVEKGMVWPFKA